ncbi:hypothetical protein Dimus_039438 [Dionaea muscipula]
MIEQAARLEDAMIAVRGTSQKRPREEPAQSHPQSGGNSSGNKKKKFHPASYESSGGSSFQQWFCKKCKKRHSRGRACDGSPSTCHTCGKQGHISPMCRSGGRQQSQSGSQGFQRQTSSHQQGSGRQQQQTSVASEVDSVQKTAQTGSASTGQKGKGVASGGECPLIPGRVFTLTPVEAETSPSVVQGTLSVSSVPAHVLFDSGVTHSFASPSFLRSISIPVSALDVGMLVTTPVGSSVELHSVCRGCEVLICDRVFPADLIALDVIGFDVILGMY